METDHVTTSALSDAAEPASRRAEPKAETLEERPLALYIRYNGTTYILWGC